MIVIFVLLTFKKKKNVNGVSQRLSAKLMRHLVPKHLGKMTLFVKTLLTKKIKRTNYIK